jgi:hypothetical protein
LRYFLGHGHGLHLHVRAEILRNGLEFLSFRKSYGHLVYIKVPLLGQIVIETVFRHDGFVFLFLGPVKTLGVSFPVFFLHELPWFRSEHLLVNRLILFLHIVSDTQWVILANSQGVLMGASLSRLIIVLWEVIWTQACSL